MSDPVDQILARHGITGPWRPWSSTGVANRIYATRDVILRVATDHPDAIPDARTESVAAPVAHAAGILTPRLLAFDDTRLIIDRPYSLWERIPGEPTHQIDWTAVGYQLACLHERVTSCPDPQGWLDTPGRELDLAPLIERFAHRYPGRPETVRRIERLVAEISLVVAGAKASPCFLHNDLHLYNILGGAHGELLAFIDWGDAGWGDPTLDFAYVPFAVVPAALRGYGSLWRLGNRFEARIVWDHLQRDLELAVEHDDLGWDVAVDDYLRFLDSGG